MDKELIEFCPRCGNPKNRCHCFGTLMKRKSLQEVKAEIEALKKKAENLITAQQNKIKELKL